jgi:hypothetical protein
MLMLDGDISGTARLGKLVTVALCVAIGAPRETGATLRNRSTRLPLRTSRAGSSLIPVLEIGAE